jgi:hypothetical protein
MDETTMRIIAGVLFFIVLAILIVRLRKQRKKG